MTFPNSQAGQAAESGAALEQGNPSSFILARNTAFVSGSEAFGSLTQLCGFICTLWAFPWRESFQSTGDVNIIPAKGNTTYSAFLYWTRYGICLGLVGFQWLFCLWDALTMPTWPVPAGTMHPCVSSGHWPCLLLVCGESVGPA